MTANIKTSEMRLGNLVQYGGATAKVCQIEKSFFYCESDGSDFFTRDEEPGAKPIPLTEEWLLKFGFNKVKSDYEEAETWDFYFGVLYFDMANNSVKINGQYCLSNIPKYVHQLQNLYFALTGEELTFKSE